MPLVRIDDYIELPADGNLRWLMLRDIADKRIEERYDSSEGSYDLSDMVEYVEIIKAISDTLEVKGLPEISPSNIAEEFLFFRAKVAGVAASLNLSQKQTTVDVEQLALSAPVKERLLSQVVILRTIIAEGQFELRKSSRLDAILDQFEASLNRNEINYRDTLKAMALLAVGLGGTTAFLADAPEAFATINQLIGLQQEAADQKAEMILLPLDPAIPKLPAQLKLLSAPSNDSVDSK